MRGWLLPVLGLMVAAPQIAQACDYAPGVWGSVPGDTEDLPANAAVFLLGADVVLDDFTVTVDGVAATLVVVPELSQPGTFGDTAVRVEPEPLPGQIVVIEGTGCPPEWECPLNTFTFTATEPDDVAPAAVTDLLFNVFDHPGSLGDDCGGPSGGVSYWLHFDDGPGGEEPVRKAHRIEVLAGDSGEGEPLQTLVVYDDGNEGDRAVQILLKEEDLAGRPVAQAFCFRVTTLDASGNGTGTDQIVCDPCHVRDDPDATDVWSEPEWTNADVFPGGVCAVVGTTGESGGETTGESTGETTDVGTDSGSGGQLAERGGCACTSVPGRPSAWLALPLLLGLRRRRT